MAKGHGTESMGITLPDAFCARMRRDMTEEEFQAFLSSWGQKRSFSLRVNPLKCDRDRFLKLGWAGIKAGTDAGIETGTDAGMEETGDADPAEGDGAGSTGQKIFRRVPWEPDGFYYPEAFRPGRHPRHEAGMYYIQEASAMAPAVLCGARPGDRVLDLCAAPGGKSTKLAACLQGQGVLVANEIHPERARVLSANLERMGVRNALVTSESPQKLASHFPLFFDRIVVDAPCSGEGMFRKEEEALKQWSPENVQMCADRQSQILEEAAAMLRPGGRLVYSTCTFSPQENEGVIFRLLIDHPEFSVIDVRGEKDPAVIGNENLLSAGRPEWLGEAGIDPDLYGEAGAGTAHALRRTVRLWPHLVEGEGHFTAVLEKKDPQIRMAGQDLIPGGADAKNVQVDENNCIFGCEAKESRKRIKKDRRVKKRPGGDEPLKEAVSLWKDFCKDNLLSGGRPDAVLQIGEERLCLFGNALWGLPEGIGPGTLDGLRVLRAGLQLGMVVRGRFEPSHSLGMALGREEARRVLDLAGNSPQAYAWLRGEAVSAGVTCDNGWTLVQIDACSAGWGKVSGEIVKNHYPKGLRKGSSYG